MPVQDALDALIMNLSRCRLGLFCWCFDDLYALPFSLTGCNERCLTTPKLQLWDAAIWVTRCAKLRRERPHGNRDARCVKGWGRSRLIRIWPCPSELSLHGVSRFVL